MRFRNQLRGSSYGPRYSDRTSDFMIRRAIYAGLLGVALAQPASARCAYHPETLATVTVQSCVAVTFGATDSKWTWGPQYSLNGEDTWPMYRAGDNLSGTLLTVSVKKSRFIFTDGHWRNGTHRWAKGEIRNLFLKEDAAKVCPAVLPTDITVQTQLVCCDTFPGWSGCLLPRNIALVKILADVAQRP
jgi:hypothetical protein